MSDAAAVLMILGVLFGVAVVVCSMMVLVQTFTVLSLVKRWLRVRIAADSMKLSEHQREASVRTEFLGS